MARLPVPVIPIRDGRQGRGRHPVALRTVHPDVIADLNALDTTLRTCESVVDVEELRRRIDELEHQAADPGLWNDQETRPAGHEPALPRAGRAAPDRGTTRATRRDADPLRTGRRRRPRRGGRRRRRAREPARRHRGDGSQDHALGRVRRARRAHQHPLRCRRYRRCRLGRDAHAYVHPLGGEARLRRRGLRHVVRRRSRTQERGRSRSRGPVHVRHVVRRDGHPTGSFASAPSTTRGVVRRRSPRSRLLPVVETTDHIEINENDIRVDVYRSSGPGGQSVNTTGLRRSTHAHPDGNRRHLSEREVAAPEQGIGDARPAGKAARGQASGRARRDGCAQGRQRQLVGQTRCAPMFCIRTRWSRTCVPSTRSTTRRQCSTATSTGSSRPAFRWRMSENQSA